MPVEIRELLIKTQITSPDPAAQQQNNNLEIEKWRAEMQEMVKRLTLPKRRSFLNR